MTLLMHLMLQHRANAQAFLLHSCSVKPNLSKRSTESGLDRDGLRALVGPSLGSQAKHCKHGSEVLYVRIGQPKTRHRAAASQHVRVDHLGVACWIVDALPSTPGWRKIWNGSWAAFKLRFDALQSEGHTFSSLQFATRWCYFSFQKLG